MRKVSCPCIAHAQQGDLSFFLTFAVWTRRAEKVDDRKLAHVVMGKGGKVEVGGEGSVRVQ